MSHDPELAQQLEDSLRPIMIPRAALRLKLNPHSLALLVWMEYRFATTPTDSGIPRYSEPTTIYTEDALADVPGLTDEAVGMAKFELAHHGVLRARDGGWDGAFTLGEDETRVIRHKRPK